MTEERAHELACRLGAEFAEMRKGNFDINFVSDFIDKHFIERDELKQKVEEYFKDLIAIPFPQLTKQKLLEFIFKENNK